MSKQNQQWMDYLHAVYEQWMDRMPVIKDEVPMINMTINMTIGITHDDPFWSSFDHAVRMANYHGMLSNKEYEFWLDFVEEEEYPTEDELNRFVDICKEGTKTANSCEFLSLIDLIEDIEGYWPYA